MKSDENYNEDTYVIGLYVILFDLPPLPKLIQMIPLAERCFSSFSSLYISQCEESPSSSSLHKVLSLDVDSVDTSSWLNPLLTSLLLDNNNHSNRRQELCK